MIMADSQANPEVDLDNVIDRLLEGESFVSIYLVRMVQGDKEEQGICAYTVLARERGCQDAA